VFDEIRDSLRNRLDPRRFEHTLRVELTAVDLAKAHARTCTEETGLDRWRVHLAALLHDCARYLPGDEMLRRARESGIVIDEVDKIHRILLHARPLVSRCRDHTRCGG